jgi:type IX secretion system PorP/SprF family membrane protein
MLKRVVHSFILAFGILIGTGIHEAKAQDPQFTQFYANPLYLNPAFAGSKICPRISLNYRNQWPAIPGQFVTYSASYDQHVDVLSGGLGLMVYNDQAGSGTLRTTNISGMYSYTLNVSSTFSIRAGFQASYFQKTIDWSDLTFGDMIDPRYGFVYPTGETPGSDQVNNADFSVGFLGYSEKVFVGAAIHHLTEPVESFFSDNNARLYRKYTVHAGMNIPFNDRFPEEGSISPNILFQRQGPAQQLMLGLYGKKGPFVLGLWYRTRDSFIVLGGIQLENFRFGYSYDLTVSRLTNKPGGSHELSVGIQLPCRTKPRKFRPLACPEF